MASLQPPQIHTSGPGGAHSTIPSSTVGGRFDFDDGGIYIGGWQDGKAHGHGVCTGPKSQGEYSGSWSYGFELSGVYKWPSGATYEGQWQNGKRHGIGVEYRGKWVYKGEWTQGYKGRYGVRASLLSAAKYEGTWANGLQDGYGSETYADGGTYQGQWLRGMRHGYGVRQSAPYGHCSVTKTAMMKSVTHTSLHSLDTEGEGTLVDHKRDAAMRGGFVLVVRNSGNQRRRNSLSEKTSTIGSSILKGLRLKKQKSTGDLDVRSNRSTASVASSTESGISTGTSVRGDNDQGDAGSNASFLSQDGDISDPSTTETYMGEWKNDKRSGFGICERSDGIRYEGEWYNNKKYGYGVTLFRDGAKEEGKYKNNQLVTSVKKKHLFVLRSSKIRERIDSAVQAAHRAQQIALQKADIAISRTATARGKGEQADYGASTARADSQLAFSTAKQYGGADVSSQLQVPEAPLRRRLSDFSQIRRGTKDQIAQLPVMGGPSQTKQFLDPNEPFGGRRGSFRNQAQDSLLQPSSGPGYQAPPQQQQQYHHPAGASQQFNVPQMNLEPPTPYAAPQPHFPPPPQVQGPARPSPAHSHPLQQQQMQQQQQAPQQSHPQLNPYQQQQPPPHHQQQLQQPQHHGQDSFTDHFDYYSYNTLVSRYANPGKAPGQQGQPIPRQRRSRPPSVAPNPPTMSTNQHHLPSEPAPSVSSNSPASVRGYATEHQSPDSGVGSLNLDDGLLMMQRRRDTGASSSTLMPDAFSINSMSMDECPTPGRQQLRTASLYRPGVVPGPAGGGGGGGGLRRKPSIQPAIFKQPTPAMTREEVSALSHAQREHVRNEAEMAERLARNPFLYLVNPRFKDWLSRQQLIILVILINVSLAILFYKLLG